MVGNENEVNTPAAGAARSVHPAAARASCGAKHACDRSPCDSDPRAVRIAVGSDEVFACVNHGAKLYATVEHAEIHPVGGPQGPNARLAAEVRRRAAGMAPFFWMYQTASAEPIPSPLQSLWQSSSSLLHSAFHHRPPWKS